jgi:Nuclease-related domain
VPAGGSAEEEAERARRSAERLARRADNAARRADRFDAGADGEQVVAAQLAPLTAQGWYVLHDRKAPAGGNIDHVVVGPPGVFVIDAKNWSYPIAVDGDVVRTGRYRRDRAVDAVLEQVAHVRVAVPDVVPVRGVIALAGADIDRPHVKIRDVILMGATRLGEALARAAHRLTPAQVEQLVPVLLAALPTAAPSSPVTPADASGAGVTDEVELRKVFERANRLVYLTTWRKGGAHRLYATDHHGTAWGWTDVITGDVHVEITGDDAKLAQAVLRAATPTGVRLASSDLPKVRIRIPGGRIFALGGIHVSVIVAQEWRKGATHRLYATLIDPNEGTFALGYVDVATGALHPAIDGKVSRDRQDASHYLRIVHGKRPAPTSSP